MTDPYAHVVLPDIRLSTFMGDIYRLEYEDPIDGYRACFVMEPRTRERVLNLHGAFHAGDFVFRSRAEAVEAAEEFKQAFKERHARTTPIEQVFLR